jgi:FAD/FMN-containing dehydrogenase/Fe-S oxidoreductase
MKLNQNTISKIGKELQSLVKGEVLFDEFSRGRYSTDASIYQITPIGIVIPKDTDDVLRVLEYCKLNELPILPRGAGSSQCGQTVGECVVLDYSKFHNQILDIDLNEKTAWVQPGLVLDQLNVKLKQYDLCFPVDVSTSSRATIGGMTGNNSCGSRSLYYGNMVHNVEAIEAILDDGSLYTFENINKDYLITKNNQNRQYKIIEELIKIYQNNKQEINDNFPKTQRRVGGYNLDLINPNGFNTSNILVGSEGTLSLFNKVKLKLSPIPKQKMLGLCSFQNFRQAMEITKEIVKLKPTAVELMDDNLLNLAKMIPMFQGSIKKYFQGNPQAVLMVEFIDDNLSEVKHKIKDLETLILSQNKNNVFSFYENLKDQKEIFEMRKAGLNILMSLKGDRKPVAFIEDCAVSLDHLADYTTRLNEVFKKYNTSGMFYAHASVGTLHVRPIINMKSDQDIKNMRSITEEAFQMVKEYKGSHSGEHGDGILRSEFHEMMFGKKLVNAFENVKDLFDQKNLFNPNKIVRSYKQNDRSLMRYKADYKSEKITTHYDWSNWGELSDAVEMCNNNGACRKLDSGVMCPSYRVTKDEKDLVRGRANTLRLALSNQLPKSAFVSKEMFETMELCVGCKACQRECPMSVDISKMKSEFLFHYYKKFSMKLKDKIISNMPNNIGFIKLMAPIFNKVKNIPILNKVLELLFNFSTKRTMPEVQNISPLKNIYYSQNNYQNKVILLADTFNINFEIQNLIYAIKVLNKFGYKAIIPNFDDDSLGRPLCCGRTYISYGQLDKAQAEMQRFTNYIINNNHASTPVVGIEPSCLLTFDDEFKSLKNIDNKEKIKNKFYLIEEFILEQIKDGKKLSTNKFLHNVLVHGHCHQKSQDRLKGLLELLTTLNIKHKSIETSCCGMAGSFGYDVKNYDISKKMAHLTLVPTIKKELKDNDIIVANGTSCRHQISDFADQKPQHISQLLFNIFETVN